MMTNALLSFATIEVFLFGLRESFRLDGLFKTFLPIVMTFQGDLLGD